MPSLYDIESDLMALVECADTVTEEQAEEYRLALQAALTNSVAKRQRVGEFLAHCELHEAACDTEIKRLTRLKSTYGNARDRLEKYVIRTITEMGADEKGNYRTLEGKTVKLSVAKTAEAVLIEEGAPVPYKYLSSTVTMPTEMWVKIIDCLDVEVLGKATEVKEVISPVKSLLKKAIQDKIEIPGVTLKGGFRLVMK